MWLVFVQSRAHLSFVYGAHSCVTIAGILLSYCPNVSGIVHTVVLSLFTYCQWVVLFFVPSYSVLLTSIIHSPYNLYNLTMLFVLCIIHMLHCCMSNFLSSLADSLVSLTPDSSVLLLLPHPYLLVCACNCTYIRT